MASSEGHATLAYALVALITLSALAFLLSQPTDFAKWVQKKKYQYEVTFALYMLTPTEKFIFNSVLFLFVSMLGIAACLYLPNHISIISRRVFYYWAGDANSTASAPQRAAESLWNTASKATDAVMGAASGLAGTAYEATANATQAVAEEVVA